MTTNIEKSEEISCFQVLDVFLKTEVFVIKTLDPELDPHPDLKPQL